VRRGILRKNGIFKKGVSIMKVILMDAEIPPGQEIKVGPFEVCSFELVTTGPATINFQSLAPNHCKVFVRAEPGQPIRCSVVADLSVPEPGTD
jgi:hypothetical protein